MFNGRNEDYSEFKLHFQQLCSGEGYPAVIELAQLKHKIPRETQNAIHGVTVPETSWSRLNEIYGNREAAILSALRRLRGFKTTKTLECDQVIEVVGAVQRCRTVLEGLRAMSDFHADRETTAEIVHHLPVEAQSRWYHRKPPKDESQLEKSLSLLEWLEEERQAAVLSI